MGCKDKTFSAKSNFICNFTTDDGQTITGIHHPRPHLELWRDGAPAGHKPAGGEQARRRTGGGDRRRTLCPVRPQRHPHRKGTRTAAHCGEDSGGLRRNREHHRIKNEGG